MVGGSGRALCTFFIMVQIILVPKSLYSLIFLLYKTVWAMCNCWKSYLVGFFWFGGCVCLFLCSHSLQCLTAFRECLGTIVRKKGQIPIESMEIKSLDGTTCPNYYRKCHFISESIIMKLKLFSGYLWYFSPFFGRQGDKTKRKKVI